MQAGEGRDWEADEGLEVQTRVASWTRWEAHS